MAIGNELSLYCRCEVNLSQRPDCNAVLVQHSGEYQRRRLKFRGQIFYDRFIECFIDATETDHERTATYFVTFFRLVRRLVCRSLD